MCFSLRKASVIQLIKAHTVPSVLCHFLKLGTLKYSPTPKKEEQHSTTYLERMKDDNFLKKKFVTWIFFMVIWSFPKFIATKEWGRMPWLEWLTQWRNGERRSPVISDESSITNNNLAISYQAETKNAGSCYSFIYLLIFIFIFIIFLIRFLPLKTKSIYSSSSQLMNLTS